MKTIKVKIYKFKELSEAVQNELVEKNRDINYDDYVSIRTELFSEFIEKLDSNGFTNATIQYSGFYSQGDGLSFNSNIDIDYFAETTKEKTIAKLINNGDIDVFTIVNTSFANHYNHEHTRYVTASYLEDKYNNINAILGVLKGKIEAKRLEYCKEFYSTLESIYESLHTDEAVKIAIRNNKDYYLKDGQIYND